MNCLLLFQRTFWKYRATKTLKFFLKEKVYTTQHTAHWLTRVRVLLLSDFKMAIPTHHVSYKTGTDDDDILMAIAQLQEDLKKKYGYLPAVHRLDDKIGFCLQGCYIYPGYYIFTRFFHDFFFKKKNTGVMPGPKVDIVSATKEDGSTHLVDKIDNTRVVLYKQIHDLLLNKGPSVKACLHLQQFKYCFLNIRI